MKTILIIYLIISFITLFVILLMGKYTIIHYTELMTDENTKEIKFKKVSTIEKIISVIRIVIISFFPILHIVLLLIYVLKFPECIEKAMDNLDEMVEN